MFNGLSYPCSILCRLKNEREIDIDFTNYYWLMTKMNFIFHFPLVRLLVYANISKWWGDGGKGGGGGSKSLQKLFRQWIIRLELTIVNCLKQEAIRL